MPPDSVPSPSPQTDCRDRDARPWSALPLETFSLQICKNPHGCASLLPVLSPNKETDRGFRMVLSAEHVCTERVVSGFKKQMQNTTCGMASLAALLSCLGTEGEGMQMETRCQKASVCTETAAEEEGDVRSWSGGPFSEPFLLEKFRDSPLLPKTLHTEGLTLDALCQLTDAALEAMQSQKRTKRTHMPEVQSSEHVDGFRTALIRHLSPPPSSSCQTGSDDNKQCDPAGGLPLLVNYNMGSLGQEGLRGHFAVAAAFHESSDSVLLLDVWPETPVCWVPVALLCEAMGTVDSASKLTRGYIELVEQECS
uniref:glutathione gamma-glutamylcysteinyltransferase n=1 Tax=Chromera velia CCMP2878 TaxID=1169474 RepID=A0A0G4G354_9ALVE|mmetsp:Transcript_24534/g.48122  ORF Transcript_24534/g.48122 Transcript_24534/m.48122 type:complete len:310 (+) Transcript_24534:181-1110(+)|eukprot:Cvel_4083.t1-p1 / transcript=Cvel_4083.t1 / gene=Cvel_4083 / organism=Chromera_velia_CCMP2878 / gene_product=Glutathione gamma-glutamylcysteinyltransferase 3, putative / transcript_product=Glutathione gamma-glutamylcysteinyltransferase 3, putative / location=Cvel_scaffold174:7338-8264(-) / protein_length=309 / sequence_SO=supercontig / SO=protein_coding / is_pseudo=false